MLRKLEELFNNKTIQYDVNKIAKARVGHTEWKKVHTC